MTFMPHAHFRSAQAALCERALATLGYGQLADCDIAAEGKESVVLFPHELPDRVVKIPLMTESAFTNQRRRDEAEWLRRFDGMEGEHFVVPRLIATTEAPFSMVMTRLGESLSGLNLQDPDKPRDLYKNVGTAVGEFAAELHMRYNQVDYDIHKSNLTREPDGRIGIIDFSMVHPGQAGWNFAALLAERPNVVPRAVDVFEERTGAIVDPTMVMNFAMVAQTLVCRSDSAIKQQNIRTNMALWSALEPTRGDFTRAYSEMIASFR